MRDRVRRTGTSRLPLSSQSNNSRLIATAELQTLTSRRMLVNAFWSRRVCVKIGWPRYLSDVRFLLRHRKRGLRDGRKPANPVKRRFAAASENPRPLCRPRQLRRPLSENSGLICARARPDRRGEIKRGRFPGPT
ncbi:hypothetical protein SKAU_G00402580 [Synaphobranchus kaupii]|uniref:Uncharacterized protein n=1 Tax=Synaphobranchus kaupii TaxID=118154 RepID=A0A9Q1ICG9_SYNKA|nr:hypothetical protein SKAU_G00402580 [Synaphobranchus kaupii]